MIEFIFGFALGRITKDANPLELIVGFVGAIIMISMLSATLYIVWISTPYAYEVIKSMGIFPVYIVEYLRVKEVTDGNLFDYVFQTPKRLAVFAMAMMLLLGGLTVGLIAVRGTLNFIMKTIKSSKLKSGT